MQKVEAQKITTREARYVCRRVIAKGVVVASLHPVIGPVYWDYCDESDCNAPDHYGLTDNLRNAHVFSTRERSYSYIAEFTRQILECNVEYDDEEYGDLEDEDYRWEERRTFSWTFSELARKAQCTVEEFVTWVGTTLWVEFECPPRVEFLRDINGFVGYRPEWTQNLDEAMTFDSSVLTSSDDFDVRSYGRCIPIGEAHDIGAVKNLSNPFINHALEADVAYTHFRLNTRYPPQPNSWVGSDERAFRHAAAAGRIHALQKSNLPASGHIAPFPELRKVFEMSQKLTLHLMENPAPAQDDAQTSR
ncbi:hypothetical protein [Pseudoduganella sp. R-34]|uniref:hypothetical protein n=1 Tax=Pseudoduganella sp. R-34 TaxID=3404062 RepID=UPI003CF2A4C1